MWTVHSLLRGRDSAVESAVALTDTLRPRCCTPALPRAQSKSLGLRVQKKLMGMTVKGKGTAKAFIDEDSGETMAHLTRPPYRITRNRDRHVCAPAHERLRSSGWDPASRWG